MNYVQKFEMLGRRQLEIHEATIMLQQIQDELSSHPTFATAWGATAVLANAVIIPLNVVVNAFELRAASSAYQMLVRQLYGKFGKSGSRVDGHAKTALSLLKQGIISELTRKSLTTYVPGVNIIVGLAEDSLAALQAAQLVNVGNSEIALLAASLNARISAANHQLIQLGARRAEILALMQLRERTA